MKTLFGQRLKDVLKKEKSKESTENAIPRIYEGLEWDTGGLFLRYDQHVTNLKKFEWARAPSPQEVFSLLLDYTQGSTGHYYSRVVEDIINSTAEYFCDAIKINDNHLYVFENIRDLFFESENQIFAMDKDTKYDILRIFELGGNIKWGHNRICDFPDKIINYFYTRNLDELPDVFQSDVSFFIPEPDKLSVLVRSEDFMYSIDCASGCHISRGVRKR